jgi:hypothetical protein
MIFKCFTIVRPVGQTAHHLLGHAVHRLFGKDRVHAFARGPAHATAVRLMKMVCVAAGVAAVSAGGLVMRGTPPGAAAPGKSGVVPVFAAPFGPPALPTSFGQDTPFPLVFDQTGGWLDEAALQLREAVDSVLVAPIPTDSFDGDSLPDTQNPAAPVPEPPTTSVLGAYLFGFAMSWRRILRVSKK